MNSVNLFFVKNRKHQKIIKKIVNEHKITGRDPVGKRPA